MSAGICILNKNAIAMAADSAVTIGNHLAVHNSANKLFSMSRIAPVGAIIYSSTSLMGVPFELIIKEYKKKIGDFTFPLLKDYFSDFVNFIERNKDLFLLEQHEESYIKSVFANLIDGLI